MKTIIRQNFPCSWRYHKFGEFEKMGVTNDLESFVKAIDPFAKNTSGRLQSADAYYFLEESKMSNEKTYTEYLMDGLKKHFENTTHKEREELWDKIMENNPYNYLTYSAGRIAGADLALDRVEKWVADLNAAPNPLKPETWPTVEETFPDIDLKEAWPIDEGVLAWMHDGEWRYGILSEADDVYAQDRVLILKP